MKHMSGPRPQFVAWLFAGRSALLEEIAAFAHRIAPAGAANGLAQVLLKLTAPGVPDIYQGTEYWDLSLVDPDNRTAVDFAVRQKSQDAALSDGLAAQWPDGRLKQFLIKRVLGLRKEMPALFSEGIYQPLETAGPMAAHVVAFARLPERFSGHRCLLPLYRALHGCRRSACAAFSAVHKYGNPRSCGMLRNLF